MLDRTLRLKYEFIKNFKITQKKYGKLTNNIVSKKLRKIRYRQVLHDIHNIVDTGSIGGTRKVFPASSEYKVNQVGLYTERL